MVAAPGPPLEALYGDATIVTLAGVIFAVPRHPLGIRPMSIQPAQDRPAQHRNHETTLIKETDVQIGRCFMTR
jgi:hypothetical protein